MKYPETARRLSEAMNDINIKAVDLSAKSGVSKSSISHYINGTHTPSNVAAASLGEVLGVNPVWLMGFDVSKNEQPKSPDDIFIEKFQRLEPHEQDVVMQLVDTLLENARKKERRASAS